MQADEWQDFHNRFMHLADKQKQIVRATRKDFLLGYCSFADPEFEGDCCVLPTLELAKLELSKGPDELLKAQFEALATAAGKALGCPKDVQPFKFWLYRLFMHLRGTESKHVFAPIQTVKIGTVTVERAGGAITDVCEASAIFCARLEKQALEQSEPHEPAPKPFSPENNGKTARSAETKPTATLPPTWDELRKRDSISQKEAAGYLRCNPKTVQRLVKANELKQSTKKRIICNELLRHQIRNVHGPHVLP